MLKIATREEISAYRESESLNQSKVKKLLDGIHNLDEVLDPSKQHFIVGGAVDTLLLGEEGDFDKLYYVGQGAKKPTESVLKVLEEVFQMCFADYEEYLLTTIKVTATMFEGGSEVVVTQDTIEEEPTITSFKEFTGSYEDKDTYILDAAERTEYNPRWGAEAKLKNLKTADAIEYFDNLLESYGRLIIDASTYQNIKNIVHSLKTHERTWRYFDREHLQSLNGITSYYQLPVFFDYKSPEGGQIIPCKGLLDMVLVFRNAEGKIAQIIGIDLKTLAGNSLYFINSLKQRRYDIQASWYIEGLKNYFVEELEEGTPIKFQFVVESTTFPGKPLVFAASEELLAIGRYGRKAISLVETNMFTEGECSAIIQREVKGIQQLMETYIYHNENGWDEEREIREANGQPLLLNWN
jgi:hypothetical protein